MNQQNSDEKQIVIYTDGSSIGNPGPGGYAAVLTYLGKEKILNQGFRLTTNNRMELMAVIEGLKALKRKDLKVKIVSDSKYVLDSITKRWVYGWVKKGFKNKKNKDLWEMFLKVEKDIDITYSWVKGHNGHHYNEKCDQLAFKAASEAPQAIDQGYEALQ